ncbi:MAG: sulfatase-like hydrolase/transferase, partial [bacterium]
MLFYWLSFTLCITGFWISKKFGEPSFEQVFYHVQFSLTGLMQADPELVKSFLKNCLIYPVVLALFVYLYEILLNTIRKIGLKRSVLIFKRTSYKFMRTIFGFSLFFFQKKLPIFFLIGASIFFLSKISFWSYLQDQKRKDLFSENYVEPGQITSPQKKKNLILIYVESLETTYSDDQIFGTDLLTELNAKTKGASSFENYRQTSGTGWTIAAMVSTQCGIPLQPSFYDANDFGESVKYFLPRATCLGDMLKRAGYKNVFMGGASLLFAGKGKFLKAHGYDELYGKEEWEKLNQDVFDGWGLHDDLLLNNAKKRLDELEKGPTPFNLTILTVDTHHPNGFLSDFCIKRRASNFTGIVKCTSVLLSDFIEYIYKQNYIKNTTVVILGDHLAMKNEIYEKITKDPNRTIFNKFISSEPLKRNREEFSHFSVLPSVLYSMGFRFKDNRLALGASGFGELD